MVVEPKKTAKAAAAPKAEAETEVKEAAPVKKTAARKTTAAKTTAKKSAQSKTDEAKTPAKRTTARKTAAKKSVQPEAVVHFQFNGKDLAAQDLLNRAMEAYKESHPDQEIKTIELYVVASEDAAYYVVNGEGSDDFKISL